MSYNKTNWQNLPSTDTPVIANSLNNMETGIADANGAIGVNTYSASSTYSVGDYCIYNNKLYRCKTAIATAEDFNSTKWQEIKIMEEMANTGVTVSPTEPTGNNKNKVWFKRGKNLFNGLEVGTLDGTGHPTSSNARLRSANFSIVNPSTKYTIKVFSYNTSKGTPKVYIIYYNQNNDFISASGWQDNNYTFITPNNCYYVKVIFYLSNSTSQTLTTSDITQVQLEQGTTATTYEEYIEPKIYTKNDNNVYENFMNNTILESGGSSAGRYIKYVDGTMICYGKATFSVSFAASNSTTQIENPFTFPVQFAENPTIMVNTFNDEDYTFAVVYGTIRNSTAVSKIALYRPFSGSGRVGIGYIAIGIWK